MHTFLQFGSPLAAMLVLLGCSAFFSCCEAAMFYLGREERQELRVGSVRRRLADKLLDAPKRLLTAILFWNLLINISYFALAAMISVRLENSGETTMVGVVSVGAVFALVIFGEMLPKMVAVIQPATVAGVVSIPLAASVRAVDKLMPLLSGINLLSRRVLFPHLEHEPYLDLSDLERAITVGTTDETLAQQERIVLQNILALSDMRAEELMWPRRHFRSFRPPVRLEDLDGQIPSGGYMLVTEPDSDEVVGSISLRRLVDVPEEHLELVAEPVVYVPWSANVAATFEELRNHRRQVAAVVNEHGETIGIVTMDDILETVFHHPGSRSERTMRTPSLVKLPDGGWEVTGMTTLRRLSKRLGIVLPDTHSVTVAGVLQEELQRLPLAGDKVRWGDLNFNVLAAPDRGMLKARLDVVEPEEPAP